MADPRSCGALMNGIIRQLFYEENEFTNDVLHKQIFPDMHEDEFNSLLNKYKGIVKVCREIPIYRPSKTLPHFKVHSTFCYI